MDPSTRSTLLRHHKGKNKGIIYGRQISMAWNATYVSLKRKPMNICYSQAWATSSFIRIFLERPQNHEQAENARWVLKYALYPAREREQLEHFAQKRFDKFFQISALVFH